MNSTAILSLLSDLYMQVQAQQAQLDRLAQEASGQQPERPADAPMEGPEAMSEMARGQSE